MRLNELKSDKVNKELIVNAIKKNCKPFLAAIDYKPGSYVMWRGVKTNINNPITKVVCPLNRSPMDTRKDFHKLADKFFKKKFGINFRSNSIFATGNRDEAETYGFESDGFTCMFMPIGNFKFCWSEKILDFYSELENELSKIDATTDKQLYDAELKFLASADYKNNDLKNAILSRNEIMIHCKTGYLIDEKYYNLIGNTKWSAS